MTQPASGVRFLRKGITRFYFVPTIAGSIPTEAEVDAGTELTPQLAEVNGFAFANSPIQTPDMANTFVTQIPGEDTAEDSSLTFYEIGGTNAIRTALAKGTTGFIVIVPQGTAGADIASGDIVDVWPVQVSANTKAFTAANESAMYTVSFAIRLTPGFDLTMTA